MSDPLRRLRQSHAIEHATVAVLLEQRQGRRMRAAGLSYPGGFVLLCASEQQEVESAVRLAHARLAAGQYHLAVSDYCGTNIVMTALGAALAVRLSSRKRGPFTGSIAAAAVALVLSPIAGHELQRRVTTLADVRERVPGAVRQLADTPAGRIYHVSIA